MGPSLANGLEESRQVVSSQSLSSPLLHCHRPPKRMETSKEKIDRSLLFRQRVPLNGRISCAGAVSRVKELDVGIMTQGENTDTCHCTSLTHTMHTPRMPDRVICPAPVICPMHLPLPRSEILLHGQSLSSFSHCF